MADQQIQTTRPPTESVQRRYSATLASQFVQLVAAIATAGVVPRALGPAVFGNYNFILSTATAIRTFLDPYTQQAFFTFSSQDRHSGPLTKLYALVVLFQAVIIALVIGTLVLLKETDWVWPGQLADQIILVTLLEWSVFVTASLRQLGDSKGLTVHAQKIILFTALVSVFGLLGLNAIGYLNFYTYVSVGLLSSLIVGGGLIYWLLVVNREVSWAGRLRGNVNIYLTRWWRFASPLILLEYYKPIAVYLSTYLLQRWYGSIEQGNFALASKWSAFVLVFTSSALSIFWREIAHAMANKEHARAANVYLQFTHILFFLSIVLCTWLSFGSTLLVKILVGNEYAPAIPVLMIMAFYPLQQTYGQINVAALKGAERTKLVRNLGIMISIPDLLLSYFLLASVDAPIPGLNLGAVGVAIRMVVYGLISVQAYEWVSHRVFNLSYVKSLARKAGVAVIVVLCALVSMAGIGALLSHSNMLPLFTLAICSVAYFTLVWAVLLLLPEMVGLERMVLLNYIQQARAEINKYLPWRS